MEAERLRVEERVPNVVAVDWTEPLIPAEWRNDPRFRSEADLEPQLRAVRASLTNPEIERYRTLGAQVAEAVSSVAKGLTPARQERSVAGDLADSIYSLGAEPVVLLVAGAERMHFRHPLPTESALGQGAMLVVGARRDGLIVNLTRSVRFTGSPHDGERQLLNIEADVFDATRPGARLADVFEVLRTAYEVHGFDRDEWRRHHQGGPTGYFGRDPKITPGTDGFVAENQAFAWNPSARGVKTEDTILATSAGIEILTHDPVWPTVQVAGRDRPITLQL
jgi:Xaa-Pro aminopeptidase